jgi:hypothetical protein
MTPLRLALLPLLGVLLLGGCGPTAGEGCEGGGYVCEDDKVALECREGSWRAIPCKGPLGCGDVGTSIRCDTTGNVAGDACAGSAEGRALCRADGRALIECRLGVLVETQTCSSCSSDGTRVTCAP